MTAHDATTPFSRHSAILSIAGMGARDIAQTLDEARTIGVTPLEQAIASERISEAIAYRALAHFLRLPFSLERSPIADHAPWPDVEAKGVAPLDADPRGFRFAIAPRGDVLRQLISRDGPPPAGLVMTTPSRLSQDCAAAFPARMASIAAHALPDASPREACRDGPGARLIAALLALTLVASFCLAWDARATTTWFGAGIGFLFMINVAIRLAAIGTRHFAPASRGRFVMRDADLPIYTVIVPLYREAGIVPRLVAAMRALDYPAAKLDIKFLLEADDATTREALQACDLPPFMQILVAPDGEPRTKPRALNLGLATARGDLVVIFDAEDRPDPSQLRDAAAAFAAIGADFACLQARIAIENVDESWITRFFTLEYAVLFGLIVPSLAAQHLPIALGGASNHFRVSALRAVGGWDAWNVTEDADLGLRFFRRGYRVGAIDSITWEEAPISFRPWLRQRTRWLKGWMQTSIVHLSSPRRPVSDLGRFPFACSLAASVGVVLSALFGPLFVALAVATVSADIPDVSQGPAAALIWAFAVTLLAAGVAATVIPSAAAVLRFRLLRLAPWILLLPFYYLLTSAAAWRALGELVLRPHHWHKTEHGLSKQIATPAAAERFSHAHGESGVRQIDEDRFGVGEPGEAAQRQRA